MGFEKDRAININEKHTNTFTCKASNEIEYYVLYQEPIAGIVIEYI